MCIAEMNVVINNGFTLYRHLQINKKHVYKEISYEKKHMKYFYNNADP